MRRPNGYWNLKTLKESSSSHETISSWSKADMGAYIAARRLGLIDQVTKHMLSHAESISKSRTKWTLEACLKSAKKYTKRLDWERGDPTAYGASKRHRWYEQCTAHMLLAKKRNNFWDEETCLAEAKKYKNISSWVKANGSSYHAAQSNPNWFKKCIAHMDKLWEKKWTVKTVLEDAKKYSTLQNWAKSSTGYGAALKLKIIKEATAHMNKNPKWFGVSKVHQILQSFDLEYVDEQMFDDCRDKRKLPFDFYVPSLNLLIEHHGIQHQRGWQGKGAAEIKRRDEIKKKFAKDNGFNYLAIEEWNISNPAEMEFIILSTIAKINPQLKLTKRNLSTEELFKTEAKSKFNLESLQKIANQYESRVAFKRGNEPAYNFACRNKYIDSICGHMMSKAQAQSKRLTKWTKEKVIQSAAKFKTAREWCSKEGSAYNAARKNGWLNEASIHFPNGRK